MRIYWKRNLKRVLDAKRRFAARVWYRRNAIFFLDLPKTNDYISISFAGIAQLVERNLAKVDVAGSSPVSRSAKAQREAKITGGQAPYKLEFGNSS